MKEVILIMFILACVRPFTGGHHEYSHKRCLIATMTLAYFIILISKSSNLNNISTILLNIVNIFSIYHQSHIINTYMNITKESLIRRNKTIAVLNSIILSIISVILIKYEIYSNIITWTLTMNVYLMFNLRESKGGINMNYKRYKLTITCVVMFNWVRVRQRYKLTITIVVVSGGTASMVGIGVEDMPKSLKDRR